MLKKLFLFTTIVFMYANSVYAGHVEGGTIALVKTANLNEYEVQLSIFRFCGSSPALPTQLAGIYSVSTSQNISLSLPLFSHTQIATGFCSPVGGFNCSGGTGVEEYLYKSITILTPASDWVAVYSTCCLNVGITNINNAGNYNSFFETHLDNLNFPDNSTPVFNQNPSMYECLGVQTTHVNSAADVDGDQLEYYLSPAGDYGGVLITNYALNLDYNNFLVSGTPITMNNISGDITFTPTQPAVALMLVKVKAYRNGILCSVTDRESVLRVISGVVGVEENYSAQVSIYPDYSNGMLLVKSDEIDPLPFTIYDANGKIIYSDVLKGSTTVDMLQWSSGVYILKANYKDHFFSQKFVK